MSRSMVTAALLVASASACTSRELAPTQVVVRISADVSLRDRLQILRVRTSSDDGGSWAPRDARDLPADSLRWPVDVVVVPSASAGRADRVFEVVVAALDGDEERLVEGRAISQFAPHRQLVLPLTLTLCGRPLYDVCENDSACVGAACQTCTDGRCGDTPFIPVDQLTSFDGEAGTPLDAPDAGADIGADTGPVSEVDAADAAPDDAQALPDDASCGAQGDASGDCADVDECASVNVCSATYPCRNRPGDYYCRGLFPESEVGNGPRFVAEADGAVVRDTVTGLWWQTQLPYDSPGAPDTYAGCTYPPSLVQPSPLGARCSQSQAASYCARAPGWPGDGWRLPTVTELLSIVDDTRFAPTFDLGIFPGTPLEFFWSSSPAADGSGYWAVDALEGSSSNTPADIPMAVRCVRGGDP